MSKRESESTDPCGHPGATPRGGRVTEWTLDEGVDRSLAEIPCPPQSHVRTVRAFELDGVDILAVTNDLQRWLG